MATFGKLSTTSRGDVASALRNRPTSSFKGLAPALGRERSTGQFPAAFSDGLGI